MSLDKMIADAQKAIEDSDTPEQKARAEARLTGLKDAKEAGYTLTQDDLNRVDKQNKDALNALRQDMERTLGTGWDEFKKTLEETLSDDTEEGKEGDKDNPLLQRMFQELATRDEALQSEREDRLAFQRELKQERLTNQLNEHFESLDLQKPYQKAAREFVSPRLSSIVDKAMSGEDVSEDLKAQADRLKELSPVWFEEPPDPNDGIPPRLPNSRLPNGGEPRQLTDKEREERSESVI